MYNDKWAICKAIWWPEQDTFWQDDDDDIRFILDQHAELDLYSASSLKQQSAGDHYKVIRHL